MSEQRPGQTEVCKVSLFLSSGHSKSDTVWVEVVRKVVKFESLLLQLQRLQRERESGQEAGEDGGSVCS